MLTLSISSCLQPGVEHGFTHWGEGAYNGMADWRSWDAMFAVFEMVLGLEGHSHDHGMDEDHSMEEDHDHDDEEHDHGDEDDHDHEHDDEDHMEGEDEEEETESGSGMKLLTGVAVSSFVSFLSAVM